MAVLASWNGCKKDDMEVPDDKNDFDKSAMLNNIGANIIIPAYEDLKVKVDSLHIEAESFVANPDIARLTTTQERLKKAWLSWQSCSMFEFGPAADVVLRSSINTFPADTEQIHSNLSAGSYDLEAASNTDAKGFPCLDYLLNGLAADNAGIVAIYQSGQDSANLRSYLIDVTENMQTKVDDVLSDWQGGYLTTFKNNIGSDIGSSIGLLVNQFNFDYEILKNARIGIPLGKKTLGTPLPEKVESYYGQYSSELAQLHLKNLKSLYEGDRGLGFDDYLNSLDAKHGGDLLTNITKAQLSLAIEKLDLLGNPLSNEVTQNSGAVDDAYTEIQKGLVYLKTDMPSAMGVLITYQDNDGD